MAPEQLSARALERTTQTVTVHYVEQKPKIKKAPAPKPKKVKIMSSKLPEVRNRINAVN